MTKELILLVDDDPSFLISASEVVGTAYEVMCARSVAEAGTMLRPNKFLVVASDYELPDGDGISFLERVRSVDPCTVGILLTGSDDPEVLQAARTNKSVFRVVFKPCRPDVLLGTVRTAASIAAVRRSSDPVK